MIIGEGVASFELRGTILRQNYYLNKIWAPVNIIDYNIFHADIKHTISAEEKKIGDWTNHAKNY